MTHQIFWEIAEPVMAYIGFLIQVSAVIATASYFLKVRKARKTRFDYKKERNGIVYVAIQVNQPVVAAFQNQEGVRVDYVIDPNIDLGKAVIESENDYRILTKRFKNILMQNQDKEIRVITSGMCSLNALFGQFSGLGYDIVWYHFDIMTKKYSAAPTVAQIMSKK